MGFLGVLILALRVLSVGMTGLTFLSGWHAVQNATSFGVSADSPVGSDVAGVITNLVITVASMGSWLVKIRKDPSVSGIVDVLAKLLKDRGIVLPDLDKILPADGKIIPEPAPAPAPKPAGIGGMLADVATWVDGDASNNRPIRLQWEAYGMEVQFSAVPMSDANPLPQNSDLAKLAEQVAKLVEKLETKPAAA